MYRLGFISVKYVQDSYLASDPVAFARRVQQVGDVVSGSDDQRVLVDSPTLPNQLALALAGRCAEDDWVVRLVGFEGAVHKHQVV